MIREMLGVAEGILQDLHNDHNEFASLLDRIMDCEDRSERERLFEEIKTKLLAHSHAEEEVLFRRLEASGDEQSRSIALEGTNEHELVEKHLQKMSAAGDKMSEEWTAEVTVLQDLLDHHLDTGTNTLLGVTLPDNVLVSGRLANGAVTFSVHISAISSRKRWRR
jgi:Hemerythrin HHE cation binding domain